MMKTQVLVVGSGPSGSAAAFYAAQKGAEVLLVDKEVWPRDKVCGDGQMFHAWDVYKEMGIMDEALEAGHMLYGMITSDVNERLVEFNSGKEYALGTRRYVIDDIIRRAAVRGGANFLENFEATDLINRKGRVVGVKALYNEIETEVYADQVILANGSHSMLARSLGIFNEDPETMWMGARGYFENVRGLKDLIEFHYPFADMYPAGYMWVFPEDDGIANVGVFTTSKALYDSGMRLEDYFTRWRDETKIGRERLGEARLLGDIKGWRLPSCWQLGPMHVKGCILVGDAASAIETFMGEGFFAALQTGRAVGCFVGENVQKGLISDDMIAAAEDPLAAKLNKYYQVMGGMRKYAVNTPEMFSAFTDYALTLPDEKRASFTECVYNFVEKQRGAK